MAAVAVMPAVMVTPAPVMVVVAPAPVVVVTVMMAPMAVMVVVMAAVAPAVVMAVLDLHQAGVGGGRRTRHERRRLGGPGREEAACDQHGRREQPPPGRHRIAHRQHRRLQDLAARRRGHEGDDAAGGLNEV